MSRKISLPKHVVTIVSGGREYFYFQKGRGTASPGERIRLPDDPHSPEFWVAVRSAQGISFAETPDTIGALIDAYQAAWPTLPRKLAARTQSQYRRYLQVSRDAWGELPARQLRPSHVDALMQKVGADKHGRANNVLDALRAMCRWAMGPRELLDRDPTHGVRHFAKGDGHKPWTVAQLAYAEKNLTGVLRRAFFLARYTGQRVSDIVRLGATDIEEGGFSLRQIKTGARPWCPILPQLEEEMSTWEKRPGLFLLQERGKGQGTPFSANQLWKVFAAARESHEELQGAVWHGLRANAAIDLRQNGVTALQISDMIGMSVDTVEHYCRHADRKAGGKAVLESLKERMQAKTVKK